MVEAIPALRVTGANAGRSVCSTGFRSASACTAGALRVGGRTGRGVFADPSPAGTQRGWTY